MWLAVPIAGGDQRVDADVDAHLMARWLQGDRLPIAHQHSEPVARLLNQTQGLRLARQLSMPTYGDTADAGYFEAPAVDLEAIAVLLEAKTGEAIAPPGFSPALTRRKNA